ncbi:MAG: hypothetical protein SOY65_03280 [Marinifilaceae bacterium]|nr:hypothetical protein [Marinifilaceae bacterium]
MKREYLLFFFICLFYACSKEEDVTPSGLDQNIFASPDFSSEEEWAIRCDFFEQTGVYLIFNDSLCYRNVTTPQGTYPMCEMLNLQYEITSWAAHDIEYTLLTDIREKEEMAHVLANEVLTMLPKELYPYAFFVADDFLFGMSTGWFNEPLIATASWGCYRATIVGTNDFLEMNETERYRYKRSILRGILIKTWSLLDESVYDEFFAYCEGLYGEYHDYSESVMELGWLDVCSDFDYYEKEYDMMGYIMEIFSMTNEEFEQKYAKYPIVLQKQDALVRVLERLGVQVY